MRHFCSLWCALVSAICSHKIILVFAGVLPLMFSGGFGGACLWLVVYPIDCVKTRIQVYSLTGKQKGFMKTFAGIIRTEGKTWTYILKLKFTQMGHCFPAAQFSHFTKWKSGILPLVVFSNVSKVSTSRPYLWQQGSTVDWFTSHDSIIIVWKTTTV